MVFSVHTLAQTADIRVLATTDLHGNLFPYDYYTAKPAPRGLAKIATLIAQERRDNPNALLVDCGDTIQGSPLETMHQTDIRNNATSPDPMMLAMSALRYDTMTVGNHEFNYGLRNLETARKTAHFPWLAANIEGDSGFVPYIVKSVAGVRIAIIDAIQTVELAEAKAQVSFASAFDLTVTVSAGKVTVRQLAALYPYDNTLYRIEGTGKMIRQALENAARYFRTCPADCSQPPLINQSVIGYNFDMAAGVSYEIDLHRPEGSRIVNLRFQGKPLDDGKPVEIAVNSYRVGGSAGYTMFRGAKVLWRSTEDIRELMIQFFTDKGELPTAPDGNWRVTPEEAHQELRREARQEADQPALR